MYLDDMKIGMKIEIPPVTIDKEEMMAFSRRFDDIPLHTDEEYAKTTRFGQVIAAGMMTFNAVWAEYVKVDFAAEELIAGKSSKVEWLAPVFAGDTLRATAEITALTPRNPYNGIMEITITVCNQDGIPVLKNVTESIVKRRTRTEDNVQISESQDPAMTV